MVGVLILNFKANCPKMHTGGPVLLHPWEQCQQQTWRSLCNILLLTQASLSPQLDHLWREVEQSWGKQAALFATMQKLQVYWFGDSIIDSNTMHAYMGISKQWHNLYHNQSENDFCCYVCDLWSLYNYCNLRNDIHCAMQSHDVNLATSLCMSRAVSWCEPSNHAETTGILV